MTTITTGTQIGGDRSLLNFKNYEEYLDSLVKPEDLGYLGSLRIARQVAELGYRITGETIDKESFLKRQRAVKDLLFPLYRPYVLDSELTVPQDELQQQLALRERANRLGVLSTIIYVRHLTRLNYEISGYIDYAHRLETESWKQFFRGKKKLVPRQNDLAYYNWRMGKTLLNDTTNYQTVIDQKNGLCFRNIHDRILICVDPYLISPGVDTTRARIYNLQCENIVLYDHAVRRR